jgi:hypothetical protein
LTQAYLLDIIFVGFADTDNSLENKNADTTAERRKNEKNIYNRIYLHRWTYIGDNHACRLLNSPLEQ